MSLDNGRIFSHTAFVASFWGAEAVYGKTRIIALFSLQIEDDYSGTNITLIEACTAAVILPSEFLGKKLQSQSKVTESYR